MLFSFTDLQEIRKILETETGGETCPSCHMPFDKGKKRKLIDNCGHGRCYSCMFKSEDCPLCQDSKFSGKNGKRLRVCNLRINDTYTLIAHNSHRI